MLNWLFDVLGVIYDEAEKEWMDETQYREALSLLYDRLDRGEITEEEYDEEEAVILERLQEVRRYKKEHGYTDR